MGVGRGLVRRPALVAALAAGLLVPGTASAAPPGENVATIPDYAGGEPDSPPPAETSPAPDQATQVLDAIRLAYCQPGVAAYFNFLLADEPRPAGWQSGAYWADLTPKDSLPAFRSAIAAVNARTVDCSALKGGLPSPDFVPPPAPSGLVGTPVASPPSIALSWSSSTDDTGPVSYRVYRGGVLVATVGSPSWTDTSPVAGTTYVYSVRAIDAAGNLGDATSTTIRADFSPPAAPATLSAAWAGAPARVELTWPAATDDVGVVAYEVSRDGAVLGTTSTTAFTDSVVAPSKTYTYSVVAIDGGGNRSPAVSASLTTPGDSSAPSAPTGLTAKAVSGPWRVKLSWLPSTDDVGVTGYRVYREGVVIATVGVPKYVDKAVVAGKTYHYAVSALDAAGNESLLSPTFSATTK